MQIGIAGVGIVGTAIQNYFEAQEKQTVLYDPPRGLTDISALRRCDLVFIAVPTPHTDTGFDASAIETVLPLLGDGASVVIKSTVLPGTTDQYQEKFPELSLFFSPEFLTQSRAVEEFINPTRQIVGYTNENRAQAEEILKILPKAPYMTVMKAIEAEMVKYMNNVFYALKVTYANQIYDICEALNIDYDAVMKGAVTNEPWMATNHWDVMFGGYRGYGGKCLPKDSKSLIQLGKKYNVDVSLLEQMEALNNKRVGHAERE